MKINPYQAPQADLTSTPRAKRSRALPEWGALIVITQLLCLFLPLGLGMAGLKIHPLILWACVIVTTLLCFIGIWWGIHKKRSEYVLGEVALLLTIIVLFVAGYANLR